MELEIKILANIEPEAPNTCRFTVDRPVYDGAAAFTSKAQAAGSPLAEKLFALPGVSAVRIVRNLVTVAKEESTEWQAMAGQVGQAIRAHLQSGEAAVSAEAVAQRMPDDQLRAKVGQIFEEQVNPAVAMHGGVVHLVDVKDGVVYIQMGGGCHGCGMANVTLRRGIESMIREQAPEVVDILDVTDHAAGANPYYPSSH